VVGRFPFSAFPGGWYAVAFSQDLAVGALQSLTFMGREYVLFRGASREVAMLGAHCPHMGAHLGVGGRVVGDAVRCPMHGFSFARDGVCIATGYGTKPPPTCKAGTVPLLEHGGVVLAYHDAHGAAPAWQPPPPSFAGFTRLRTHVLRNIATHPQETTENSVDLGHFAAVHRYREVEMLEPVRTDGAYLTTRYRMQRRPFLPGTRPIAAEFTVHVHGLGYSLVEVVVPSHGLESRHYVLPTPTDGEHIDLRIASCVRATARPLRWLPLRALEWLVGRMVQRHYLADVSQDLAIWENKAYVHPPRLAEGDGPVGRYRAWTKQFYPPERGESLPVLQSTAT
jgi:nitrite reductase/ring-hydroxylating ferredoxin subunit